MLSFSRQYQFSAAHRLWQSQWSEAENRQAFGHCSNVHGHNYKFVVTLTGEHSPLWGGIYDLDALDKLIHELILKKVDQQCLDTDVDFLTGKVMTVETISQCFFQQIVPHIQDTRFPTTVLYSVKVAESDDLWAETTR